MTISHYFVCFITFDTEIKNNKMINYTAEVLVVGAGPTGLALANALHKLGVSLMIVEASETTSIHTKATNLMQGTLEQLDIYGLSDVMYKQGGLMKQYMMYTYGANVSPRDMHLTESPHSDVVFLGQNLIEANLAAEFTNTGSTIHFKHRLLKLEQTDEGVKATIDANGTEVANWFKYVVGCDGPRGITRTFTICDFEPVKTGKYVWQVDATLKWKRLKTMKRMWLYYYDIGFGAVIHLPNNVTKVMAFEPKESMPNRLPTIEEMQVKLRKMTGDNTATLSNPTWLSHGELLTGVAPSMIDRRIILAGDASNPILPNGGQGLNVGIQDALNLAWKLSDVIRGHATTQLLNTYNQERRELRLALENIQLNTLKYSLPPSKFSQWFLGKYANALLNKFWYNLAKAFSQLNLNYKSSELSKELIGKKGVMAGYRILDADVVKASTDEEVSLYKELLSPKWKLLLFDNGKQCDIGDSLFVAKYSGIEKLLITSSTTTTYPTEKLYYDIDEIAHKRFGVREPSLLLVRPDNYVAIRCSASDINEILTYLKKWFPNI
jgi:2-polyprenyl-6-methoxyphenol hydroxylase-like FAD-dependent oxidoreductase